MEGKKLILTCRCCCGAGIEFVNDFGQLYIKCLSSLFSERQRSVIGTVRKTIDSLISHCYHELRLEREDIVELYDFLCATETSDEETVKNHSRLAFEHDVYLDMYYLRLAARPTWMALLTGRQYRIYNLTFDHRMTAALTEAVKEMKDVVCE